MLFAIQVEEEGMVILNSTQIKMVVPWGKKGSEIRMAYQKKRYHTRLTPSEVMTRANHMENDLLNSVNAVFNEITEIRYILARNEATPD